jgi:hypothetical protein
MGSDILSGQDSTWQNDLGAGVGGVAGAGALVFGAKPASAVNGAVTSAMQDFLNGRQISLDHARENAAVGGVLGGLAGMAGERWSEGLTRKEKGNLGEFLGDMRSTVNGLRREGGSKTADKLEGTGKWWFPDGRSGDVRFEDKFGPSASLSKNQKLAQAALGGNFWINHFLPEDIGKAASVPAATLPHFQDQSPDANSGGW